MKKNIRLIGIITVAVLILCIAVGIYFMLTVQTMKFSEAGFYPVNGTKYSVAAGDKASMDGEKDIVIIERKNEFDIETDSLPVYYEDRNAICLMSTMAYYKPIQDKKFLTYKLNLFTELENINGSLEMKSGRDSDLLKRGFLFDGKDTYIFLQETVVKYGKKKITVPPLSYAVVNYNTWVQVYDRDGDNYTFEDINNGDVIAVCADNEEYEINLGRDIVTFGDKEYLLHSSVDMYQSYF